MNLRLSSPGSVIVRRSLKLSAETAWMSRYTLWRYTEIMDVVNLDQKTVT